MKHILFVITFALIGSNAWGNDFDFKLFNKTIDSALLKSNLAKHDFYLASDYANDVAFRLPMIDSCFDNPFYTYQLNNNFDDLIQEFANGNQTNFCMQAFSALRLDEYSFTSLNNPSPGNILKEYFGANVDSAANFATAMVARQYLSAIYTTMRIMQNNPATSNIQSYLFITQYFDSVLLQVNANPEEDFFASARKEIELRKKKELFFKYAYSYDKSNTYSLGFSLFSALAEINEKNFKLAPELRNGIKSFVLDTKYGKIAIGGTGDDVYEGDFLMIVDFGGNDKYLLSDRTKYLALQRQVSVIIDFAGNDTYLAGDYNLGASAFGIGLLMDYSGNDNYIAQDVSLGASVFGVGILFDNAGNDSYKGSSFTQGAAAFGIGLLIDNDGFDTYISDSYSQGFASSKGFAALFDKNGDDSYIAQSKLLDVLRYEDRFISFSQGASLGVRPYAGSGFAYLIDMAGNDVYKCDIFGQGVAYWFGIGSLIDHSGNDKYLSHQYAQGSGIHFGFGLLEDFAGDDNYQTFSVSQACGHDIGFGSLVDFSGNDRYSADNLSLGSGNANAISLFVDIAGNDSYFTADRSNSLGFCDLRRNYGAPGLFIDANGNDFYQTLENNDTFATKNSFGFFYDYQSNSLAKAEIFSEHPIMLEPRSSSPEDLFLEASASTMADQAYVQRAIQKIADNPVSAVKLVDAKIGTKFPRERKAIGDILVLAHKGNPELISKYVLDNINSKSSEKILIAIDVAERTKILEAVPLIEKMKGNANWKIRAALANSLGTLYLPSNDTTLAELLADKHFIVRAKAAYSLAKNIRVENASIINPALNDKYYAVRYNAKLGMKQVDTLTSKIIIRNNSIENADSEIMSIITEFETSKFRRTDVKKMKSKIMKESVGNRKLIYLKLFGLENKDSRKLIKELLKSEKDKELKEVLKRK